MKDFFSSSGNRTCPNLPALSKLTPEAAGTVSLLAINIVYRADGYGLIEKW